MRRTGITSCWALAAFALALLLTAGCGGEQAESTALPSNTENEGTTPEQSEEEVQADFQETMAAYNAEEDKEKQFQLWFDFLERNPDGRYTVGTLDYLARRYYRDHSNDLAGGIAFVEEHMEQLSGDRVAQGKELLIELYGMAGNVDKMREIISDMGAKGELNYEVHLTIADSAAEAKAWDMAGEHAKAALEGLTPEAVRAAAGDDELTEAELADRVNRYKGSILTTLGRAQMESGDIDSALASFSAAEEFIAFNFVGVSTSYINLYWAKTLIAKGDYDAAMRRIAPDAIMQGHEESMEIFREAYEESGGDEAGLELAVENMRAELAREIPQFEAFTYEGEKAAWSELKGRVTLLSFWFPT